MPVVSQSGPQYILLQMIFAYLLRLPLAIEGGLLGLLAISVVDLSRQILRVPIEETLVVW